jgi:hypothetical protein
LYNEATDHYIGPCFDSGSRRDADAALLKWLNYHFFKALIFNMFHETLPFRTACPFEAVRTAKSCSQAKHYQPGYARTILHPGVTHTIFHFHPISNNVLKTFSPPHTSSLIPRAECRCYGQCASSQRCLPFGPGVPPFLQRLLVSCERSHVSFLVGRKLRQRKVRLVADTHVVSNVNHHRAG